MRYKVTFAAGFAAGYVLGTKAGHERYVQIGNAWRRFMDTPTVQQAAGVVSAQAGQVIEQAKRTVGTKVSGTVGAKLRPQPPTPAAATGEPSEPYPAADFGGHA